MPRLFLGTYLNTNDQLALGKLAECNSHLAAEWNCRIKWSKPEQLHLTWIFFGNVEHNKIDSLCLAITETINSSHPQLTKNDAALTYEKLECWFTGKIPKVLALVPNSVNANLLNHIKHIRLQLSEYAAPDVRDQSLNEFKPHITLARLANVSDQKPSLDAIDGLTSLLPITHLLDTIALIESKEQNGSHQYRTVQNFRCFGDSCRAETV